MGAASAPAPKVCPTCGERYAGDALFCPNDGTPLTTKAKPEESDPYLGREMLGHIEVRQLVGIGAMGRVYRAFQRGIDRDVAVKILHRELSANAQLVARFNREAKVASRLQHPNVVQAHLAGQLPDGALYIIMEYLDGLSLLSALGAVGGAMPLPRALHVALQICDAAGEAHAQGVVHRDLKPDNVMLVRRGEDADFVKVLDFGIARLSWGDASMATAAGLIFGTARYISPEGAQGEQVGPPGDVYAVATLLYQMLSGRTPFEGDQAVGLLVQQIHDAPPPLRAVPRAAYVPEPIAAVVMRNLAKRPGDREPDGRALGRALIDAARVSGLAPEDFGATGMLLGARPMGPMQLAPMQRTRQLQLDPEMAERLGGRTGTEISDEPSPGAWGGGGRRSPPPGAWDGGAGEARRMSPVPPDAWSEPRASSPPAETWGADPRVGAPLSEPRLARRSPLPGVETTRWVPPSGFDAQLGSPRPSPRPPAPSSGGGGGLEATLDDGDAVAMPRGALSPWPNGVRVDAYGTGQAGDAGERRGPSAQGGPYGAPPSRPSQPRGVAMHEPMYEPMHDLRVSEAPSRRSRVALLVVLCFLVGVGGAVGVAYKLGRLGASSTGAVAGLDELVARAEDALRAARFDAPPGTNVRDLTTNGLARWPNDARLLDVRARAADELVVRAEAPRRTGDAAEAGRLLRLALELDPSDHTARVQLAELEAQREAASRLPPLAPTAPVRNGAKARVDAGAAAAVPATLHVALEAQPERPRLGQPVQLVARTQTAGGASKTALAEARFEIVGPGIAGTTRLPALVDAPGVYRAAFTFFEPGSYEVTFFGKGDGASAHVTRVVAAGDAAPPPPPAPLPSVGPTAPAPLPTASGKWL